MLWTPEAVEHLSALAVEGYSGSQIAKRLGCTKGAVVGKLHRIGVHLKRSAVVSKKTIRRENQKKDDIRANSGLGTHLKDLHDGQCKYSIGRNGFGHIFCGEPATGPYCERHAEICYKKEDKQ